MGVAQETENTALVIVLLLASLSTLGISYYLYCLYKEEEAKKLRISREQEEQHMREMRELELREEKEREEWERGKGLQIHLANGFMDMSPYEFEEFISKLFQKMGYSTEMTTKSGDHGLDVIAEEGTEKIGIQVKRFKKDNKVGAREIQMALGSMHYWHVTRCIVVTTSSFSNQAIKQASASRNIIELWDREKLYRMIYQYY